MDAPPRHNSQIQPLTLDLASPPFHNARPPKPKAAQDNAVWQDRQPKKRITGHDITYGHFRWRAELSNRHFVFGMRLRHRP
ncbi:hypothetical protein SH528x_006467 [Novipirellula sp. SH528]|uniref:hypothetical protein n=1 Tax=Novipirellula sp. SH528 TaxID=3454466 RepID=UPI003F9F03C7